MSLLRAVVVAVALVPACKSAAPPLVADAPVQVGAPGEFVSDPNDFYYFDGKPFRLNRSTSEFVAGVANDTDVAALLLGAPVPARAGDPIPIRGRRFIVVTVDTAAARAGRMDSLIHAIRAKPDVWFAAPIYYQPATGVRVVPTDELIVRPKPSTSSDRLSALLKERGLRQVSLVDGTTDQYVLRIESAKNADVLRVSRDLHETGLFQWAAPDFIQELRREG